MNRTLKYKFLYLAIIVSVIAVLVTTHMYFDLGTIGFLAIALLFFVPGRIAAYFLRDLFLSRRYVGAGRYENAINASERFLLSLDQQPWRQRFIYCVFAFYTWNTRAMALNNMAAAEMSLGRLDAAEAHLDTALSLDDAYPIPYYNFAVIAAVLGDSNRSDRLMSKSIMLGYDGGAIDQAISRVAAAYARIQSFPN